MLVQLRFLFQLLRWIDTFPKFTFAQRTAT